MKLLFPSTSEDLGAAFNNALARGPLQCERRDLTSWWGRWELLASIVEDGEIVADEFHNPSTSEYVRVERTEK